MTRTFEDGLLVLFNNDTKIVEVVPLCVEEFIEHIEALTDGIIDLGLFNEDANDRRRVLRKKVASSSSRL